LKTKEAGVENGAKDRKRGGNPLGTKELRESTARGPEAGGLWVLRKNYRATQINVKTKELRK
jgi:hypothetical protein